jgi:hypothetical protein
MSFMAFKDCRENQERIVLFLYEELTDTEQIDLETHLQDCTNCNESFEQQKQLHSVLAADNGPWDVPSDLLIESRRSLANELDRIEKKRTWWRLPAFSVVFTPMRVLEWTTLLAVGLAAGVYLNSSRTPALFPTGSGPETVSNMRIVNSDTATGTVELVGDMVRPMQFKGNVKDPLTQELLVGALRDARNSGSRMSAVEVLSRKPDSLQVKDALIRALIEDDNAGVRLKALQILKPFANRDKNVQTALMNALANDEVAGIRVQAIDALKPFANDESIARTVQEVTKNDDNAFVKLQAVQFVGNRP